MEKNKVYYDTHFSADVLREALTTFREQLAADLKPITRARSITTIDETWKFDSDEEFFAAYRKPHISAYFNEYYGAPNGDFTCNYGLRASTVAVKLPRITQIETVFDVFERNATASRLPEPPENPTAPLRIFIGHGRSRQWRDLKDHLTDKHGYQVVAYEVGARAGHTIRDILDEMLTQSSFAVLVMTAEDEIGDGQMRARQNVVHELGLFQGKLGFPRAIVVAEREVELFSNIDGVQQLRFNHDNIAEVYGDVLATLYREFGDVR
jgi:hypothetical protein